MASWWFGKYDSEMNFTNTSLEEKYTKNFVAPAQGDYLIIVSINGATSNAWGKLTLRVQLDDTTTILQIENYQLNSDKDYDYRNFSAIYLAEDLGSGSHDVDVDACVNSSYTGYLKEIKVTILRLDDWLPTSGMYEYGSNESGITMTSSWQTATSITFTPDQAGDYLILAGFRARAQSAGNTHGRINYDSGSEYLPLNNSEESGDNYIEWSCEFTSYYQFLWGGIVSLPASQKSFLLELKDDDGFSAIYCRIIAIRLAAMDSSVVTDEDTSVTSTSSQWADKSEIDFTPSSTSDYLILGGTVIKPDSTSYAGHTRLNHVTGTGTGVISLSNVDSKEADNPANCIPFFTAEIKSLTNTQQIIKTQYGYAESSGTTYIKGSFIVAIRKPAGETTAYKDVSVKSSILSADTHKDIPVKASISYLYSLTGVTKDSDGNILGSCQCFLVKDNLDNTFTFVAHVVSNVSTGVYTFTGIVDNDAQYQVIAWKDNTPHVFDVTDWVLQPQ